MMPPASLLLFFTLYALAVSAHEVNLHHRLFVPSVTEIGFPTILPPWVPRATAEILSSRIAKYSPVSNLNEDLVAYRSVAGTQPLALYQVALELPGVPPNLWPFSSVKTCHLTDKTVDAIWIHVGEDAEHTPYAISYWINNIPADGACPPKSSLKSLTRITNTTVSVHSPTISPRAELRTPPALAPDGQPVKPVQEQTFIQKYWMHLLGAFLLITFIAPAPEEEKQDGGGEKR